MLRGSNNLVSRTPSNVLRPPPAGAAAVGSVFPEKEMNQASSKSDHSAIPLLGYAASLDLQLRGHAAGGCFQFDNGRTSGFKLRASSDPSTANLPQERLLGVCRMELRGGPLQECACSSPRSSDSRSRLPTVSKQRRQIDSKEPGIGSRRKYCCWVFMTLFRM
jgi:hypothetical protein